MNLKRQMVGSVLQRVVSTRVEGRIWIEIANDADSKFPFRCHLSGSMLFVRSARVLEQMATL